MSNALEVAAVGMRMQQRALDAIANNISNINTPAFKRSEMRFSELVAASSIASNDGELEKPGFDPVAGMAMSTRPMIEEQGRIEPTGNPKHIAVDGAGFIELLGPAGQILLWRGGSLRVLQDGTLATESGFPLRAGITVPADASEIRIERDGKVFAMLPEPEGASEIGIINLVKLHDPAQATRLEGGIYALDTEGDLTESAPGEDGLGHLVQSSLESSNVDLNSEMVGLLISQRAYAANAQVVRAADEFFNLANNLRR